MVKSFTMSIVAFAVQLFMGLTAFGFSEKIGDYTWYYELADGMARIQCHNPPHYSCAVSPEPKGALTLPSVLGDCPVVCIGMEAFEYCGDLTSVTIPFGVKSIEGGRL